MEARQGPARRRVIKLAIRPQHCVVALLARGREARVRYRCGCVVKVLLVARDAGRDRDVVVVVDVARTAGRRDVRAA